LVHIQGDIYHASKAHVLHRQAGFLLYLAQSSGVYILTRFQVPADAVVLIGPDMLIGSAAQQQDIVPVSDEAQRTRKSLIPVRYDLLILSPHLEIMSRVG